MDVRLLKIVRKRFEIYNYPKGLYVKFLDFFMKGNIYVLKDNGKIIDKVILDTHQGINYYDYAVFETEKECIDYLKGYILARLRYELTGKRKKRQQKNRQSAKKVYYI